MKYKLLQNLPFAEAGTIFYIYKDKKHCSKSDPSINRDSNSEENFTTQDQFFITANLNNTEWFEPIPEPKTQHFHKNGSVCEALKDKTEYFCQDFDGAIEERLWQGNDFDLTRLANHNVFLTIENCQKAIDDQAIYNKLCLKVKQIDAENGFICDWNNNKWNKYYIYYGVNPIRYYGVNPIRYYSPSACENRFQGTIYMSEQSAFYLLSDAVTDAEREVWINY